MKYCAECGTPNEDEAIFCEGCGASLNAEEDPSNGRTVMFSEEEDDTVPADTGENVPGEAIAETVTFMYCSECGAKIASGAEFCPECGARLGGSEVQTDDDQASETTDANGKKKWKKIILIAVIAVILAAGIACAYFYFFAKKSGTDGDFFTHALYVKDESLYFSDLSGKTVELADQLNDPDSWELENMIRITAGGKRVFYADKISGSEGSMYYKNTGKKKEDSEKLDSGVLYNRFYTDKNGTKAIYLKNGSIYENSLKDKEKAASSVSLFRAKEAGAYYYADEEGKLYYKKFGKEKQKVDSNVDKLVAMPEDAGCIYYFKDDTLYKGAAGKDHEKIAGGVINTFAKKDGTFYYITVSDFTGKELIDDERAEELPSEDYFCTLYYYNGNRSQLIRDRICSRDLSYDGNGDPLFILTVYNGTGKPEEGDEDESMYELEERIWELLSDHQNLCVVAEGKATDLEINPSENIIGNVNIKGVCYRPYDSIDEDDGTGDLYLMKLSGGKPERISSDVSWCRMLGDSTDILYCKDKEEYYIGDKKIGEDIESKAVGYDDVFYFVSDCDDYIGTLYKYEGGKKTKIDDDVYCYSLSVETVEKGVLYLKDYSSRRGEGELWYYNGNKSEKIDEDVAALAGSSI